ncbi:hypothetical protein [Leptolyngbya sp. PCC 6406]|uniref:hypothetical protein n=1 Tax=Leptolyngbya sp. PCC 6406 TaxID=1173264 RepID=UPI0002ABEFDC|nr:hypothetical protein [Leptolyngbya sp. PCC 6406]
MRAKFPLSRKREISSNLPDWLSQQVLLGQPGQVQVRLRGNILHVLCETEQPLPQVKALAHLVSALLEPTQGDAITRTYPQVYQLYVYSRCIGDRSPAWTAPIYLNRLERHQAQLQLQTQDPVAVAAAQSMLQTQASKTPVSKTWTEDSTTAAIVLSHLSLARQGDPEAIAWYLSEVLSALDVGVWVSVRAVPGQAKATPGKLEDKVAPRLWVFCEAAYSPDPMLIAEPVTERLRQLELTQFKDAVIVIQVQGEHQPDWSLRVDLTPPSELLAMWARWGDEAAIAQLLTEALASYPVQSSLERKDTTLHAILQGKTAADPVPTEAVMVAAIAPLLDRLAPQGLHRAMIYGQRPQAGTPDWVRCLNLPGSEHEALSVSPQVLARQRDWLALGFLLTRRLNPDLSSYLATGGVRVQVLERDDLLHVMVDGPVCPPRRQVAPAVTKVLMDLRPNGIQGLRLYGRRAGQQRPTWSYGSDFQTRQRLVPQAEPTFAASEAYLGDLLPQAEDTGLRPDLTAGAVRKQLADLGQRTLEGIRQGLVKSQFFAPQQDLPRALPPLPERDRRDALKIGLVWGLVGILAAFQVDWLMGQGLRPVEVSGSAGATDWREVREPAAGDSRATGAEDDLISAFSDLEWGTETRDSDTFREDGFADPGFPLGGPIRDSRDPNSTLVASPDRALAPTPDLLATSPYPSFRSEQMDEKLALYHQRLQESGPPDVLIIGSSRALRGVDPTALGRELAALGYGEVDVFNFGVNGSTAQVVDLTLRQILRPEELPRLILWADGARALNSGRVDVTYNGIATSEGFRQLGRINPEAAAAAEADPTIAAPTEDTSLRASYQALDQTLSDRLGQFSALYNHREQFKALVRDRILLPLSRPLTRTLITALSAEESSVESSLSNADMPLPENSRIDFDGFLSMDMRFNPATYYQLYARVSGSYDSDYEQFSLVGPQAAALKRLVQFGQEQDIPIVFVNTPLTDEYLDAYRREAENDFLEFMLQLSATEAEFIFRDLGQIWPQRYDYFSDPSHLNRYGAYQVSNRIAQDPMIPWPRAAERTP